MKQNKLFRLISYLFIVSVLFSFLNAQGVTTSGINGKIVDTDGIALPGANIIAEHTASGTTYGASTRNDGRYYLSGLRVGGPYKVTVSYIGFKNQVKDNIYLTLGVSADLNFTLSSSEIEVGEITVTAERNAVMSSDRTGAATSISKESFQVLPTISRRISDFARLTPQFGGNMSFVGQDNRLNNITVDGSYFNNSFGLGGQPGDRTGVAPISMDAVEQLQINIAPYDVRQGNFVGASINTVTKSGTNEFTGTAYYMFRNQKFMGDKAGDNAVTIGTFDYKNMGFSLGGPIIKNKLFFFVNYENEDLTSPATTWRANKGGEPITGSVTRVLASDLDQLSTFMKDKFGYDTGAYEGYDSKTPAKRFIAKLDFNLDDRNKISFRYNHLDSETDVLVSTSSSLGFGGRRGNSNALNFANANYSILENIRSYIAEWNSRIGENMANSLIVGYTSQDESRGYKGSMFPHVEILKDGAAYTSFGFEPFTPNNELRYNSFQVQNNFSLFLDNHNLTFGVSYEKYESENVFFPGSQSVYVYNSLADFYTDANDYLANKNRTTSPISLRRFQVRWANIPGMEKPVQPLEVNYFGVYAQDEWNVTKGLKVTLGLRLDMPSFGNTAFTNNLVDAMNFIDEDGKTVKYSTSKLPDSKVLFSPRFGFNYDLDGQRNTQIRGGSGLFTGKPAYVWISNQIGENGVLTGFEQLDNTKNRPFNPDPDHYKQKNVTGAPASSYGLAFTDPDFKFPQIWRSNLAIDQKLPYGFVATAEFIYNKDVNGIYYINANLAKASTAFVGPDNRPRWTTSNRINSNVTSAIVLKNQDQGSSYNLAFSLEKPFDNGFFAKAAYSYGSAKNTVDPGSIAFGSWNNNQHSGNPNQPGVGYSSNFAGNRIFLVTSYRFDYFDIGATTVSLIWEGYNQGNFSYSFSGDLNGDGGTSNDLIYIHKNKDEMNFEQFTSSGKTFTVQEQKDAWEAYILQDEYLSKNRGKYAERGGVLMPMVYRADLKIVQEVYADFLNKRNSLQFIVDFINVGNLLNKSWGVGKSITSTQPLIARGADASGQALYRLRNIGSDLIKETYRPSASTGDVYRIQFTVRYSFN